ncbi:MAG: bifunctional methylenetetrahydrofolate dehydrogenase/methenyltetrahydrofolate cyclohydrolase FolD [Pseudomonadota bacterium]
MTGQILDGRKTAAKIRDDIAQRIKRHRDQNRRAPGLAVVLVGDDPASEIYVHHKRQDCKKVGIISYAHHLTADTSESALLSLIDELNEDSKIDGILIQLPLPAHISEEKVIKRIDPAKDADGFHPYNIGCLTSRIPALHPCTPFGVIKLLEHYAIKLRGLNATVVGASNIVGRPMSLELLLAGSTVTICHRFTKNLAAAIEDADVLVSAIGKPGIIQSAWIKPGAIVVDVGTHRLTNGKLVGDIEFETAKNRAAWITPVPGGVGPMTRAMLLFNTLSIYEQEMNRENDPER